MLLLFSQARPVPAERSLPDRRTYPGARSGWARLAAKDRELTILNQTKTDLERDLVTLDQDDRRFKAVKEWQDSEVVWLDELYDLTASVPNIDKMRVTHLTANPIAAAGTQGKTGKYAARVEIKGLLTDDRKPLTALTRELDMEGYHRVEAPSVGQNQSGGIEEWVQRLGRLYLIPRAVAMLRIGACVP